MNADRADAYLYFDGDDVGAVIELRLLENDLSGAVSASEDVSQGIRWLAGALQGLLRAEILFAAGDEVFAVIPDLDKVAEVERLRREFATMAGVTISCGLGMSAAEASHQLRLAKLQGKDRTRGGAFG
jgi:hypothetical protein